MHPLKQMTQLLKLCITLCTLILPSLLLANDFEYWEKLPEEVRAIAIRKLLEAGDYKTFINTYKASHTMRKVIDADPVLKGTLNGFENEELQKLLANLQDKSKDGKENKIEPLLNRVIFISREQSSYAPYRSEILYNLGTVVFKAVQNVISTAGSENALYVFKTLADIAKYMPKEFLPLFDKLLEYVIATVPVTTNKYFFVARALIGLSENNDVPTSLTLDRALSYIEKAKGTGNNSAVFALNSVIVSLAKNENIDSKTIQFFRNNENNEKWKTDIALKKVSDALKSNPTYQKNKEAESS